MRTYARKAWEIVAYAADADIWCPSCVAEAYGPPESGGRKDREGNDIHPVFASDDHQGEVCNSCEGDIG